MILTHEIGVVFREWIIVVSGIMWQLKWIGRYAGCGDLPLEIRYEKL